MPPLADDLWELYDTNTDWTQAHDLAAEMPDRLAELQQLLLDEAVGTTSCRWTTDESSASARSWPGVPSSSAATRSCCSAAWAA